MKNRALTLMSGYSDSILENKIQKKDTELKEKARKNAMHFAENNCPNIGDKLGPYIAEFKSGYEELAAYILQHVQPSSHYPEARMEADFAGEINEDLDSEISQKKKQNQNETYTLGQFNPNNVLLRTIIALVLTFIIFIGEVAFNSKAFQVIGGSMLSALMISISLSFAVYGFSHVVPLLYKKATTRLQKILIIISALTLVSVAFIFLAALRSKYLALQAIYIQPIYFVIMNLFLFIVSSLLSFYLLPSIEEIKEHWDLHTRFKNIRNRNKEINRLKNEKVNLRADHLIATKHHMRTTHYAKYQVDRTKKMYAEAVGIFQGTNLLFRPDRTPPDCFNEEIPELKIDETIIPPTNQNPK